MIFQYFRHAMQDNERVTKSPDAGWKGILTALVVLFACLFIFNSQSTARTVRTAPQIAGGVVTEVTATSIEVKGKSYDISHARIVTIDGKKVTRDFIRKGSRVEIDIYDGEVTRVRVDNNYKSINK